MSKIKVERKPTKERLEELGGRLLQPRPAQDA